jgi:hypothetical protein
MAVASTVAPKVTSTRSEGANPWQERVTRDPAGPLLGDRTQLAVADVATVVVVAAVGWVVGTDDGPEDAGAVVWSVGEVQPVTAKAATKTAVAMMRTARMMISPG